jgi:sugar transferase (PEP-CTERM/EpsH1 system associated)
MRILFITDYLPYPLISGDRIRVYNLIMRLAVNHQVTICAPTRSQEEETSVRHLKKVCGEVETGEIKRKNLFQRLPGLAQFALTGKPLELSFLYSERLWEKVNKLSITERYDIIHIEHSRMAFYLDAVRNYHSHGTVLSFQNVAVEQYKSISNIHSGSIAKLRAKLFSLQMSQWETHTAQRFHRCVTVSANDRELLLARNPDLRIDLVPNGVDTQLYKPLPCEDLQPAILFIGTMSYPPCSDGAIYFCESILPHIRKIIGDVKLWIVGADPPPEVKKLEDDFICVTGRVPDILPYYKKSSVCVVPLRAGGGTRLKILEAMALGRPVVSTTIGCEGLEVVDWEHLLISDSPEQFAEKTVRLLTDQQLYQQISVNGRQLVEAQYDWDQIAGRLIAVYTELIANGDL